MTSNLKIFNHYILIAILYIILFFIVNTIHFNYFTVSVVLYALLLDIIITFFILIVALAIINKEYYFSKNILITIFFLLASTQVLVLYSFVIPTAVERSLSVYLLERIERNSGSLSIAEFNSIAKNDYFNDMNVTETRINEQIATGSIEIIDNQVILTDKGKAMLKAFSFIKTYFLPKKDNKIGTDEDLLIK
jgi:hypothetical protein